MGLPQFGQNLAPAATLCPHLPQDDPGAANGLPQSVQNFVPMAFGFAHFGHGA